MSATLRRRCTSWIAIFAVLLAALAPSVSQAFVSAQQQAEPWSEICSVAASQVGKELTPTSGSGRDKAVVFKHCPFCLNHTTHFALPGTLLPALPVPDRSAEVSFAAAVQLVIRFIRVAAQPRAPPAFS